MPGTTIITGAASGIGAAVALRCALPGVRLVLHTGSRASQLDHVANACRAKGATVHCVCGELAMTATVDALLGAVQVQGASLAWLPSCWARMVDSSPGRPFMSMVD